MRAGQCPGWCGAVSRSPGRPETWRRRRTWSLQRRGWTFASLSGKRFYGRSNGVNTCGGGSMVLRTTGYCCICEAEATFEADGAWLRDRYVCLRCGTIPRVRALVHILNMVAPEWRNSKMHESSPGSRYFSERCKRFSYSFFYEDVPPGGSKFGNPCENLEALTFADQTFDIFVTQDVLEHVFHPDRALAEISRVLK